VTLAAVEKALPGTSAVDQKIQRIVESVYYLIFIFLKLFFRTVNFVNK